MELPIIIWVATMMLLKNITKMFSLLLPVAKGVIMQKLKSPKVKLFLIELAEKLSKETDNDLDDIMVAKLRKSLL